MTPQDALSVDLDFAPNAGPQHPQHGVRKVHQKVVATFSAQGRTRWLEREVRVTCQLDQTQSVLRENEIRGEVVLPQSVLWVPIRLKKAVAGVPIEVDAGSTSWITPLVSTFESSLEVPVKLGPFETPGKYESSVRLRVRARHFETVPVHVNVFSQFDVRPRRLVITMNPNESHTIKLEFRGPRSPLIRPSIRNLDTASPSLRLVLGEPTPLVGAEGEQHVAADLLVRSDDMPTVHEGRVLLCPHPEATYSLPFDYVVRVSRR